MSNEIEGAVRTMTSRNVRQTDVALAPACDQRAPDMVGSSGSLADLDERQMPPALEVMDAELERATCARPSIPRMTTRVLVQRPYRAEKR